jgi:D-alanyl-lipoteichoic acid acyltransferase DltB (MBOAT superfamily)
MDAASIQFVLFGIVVAIISNFNSSRVWRSIVLLSASVVFLFLQANSPFEFLPLAAFLLLGYGGVAMLDHGWSRYMVWSIVAVIFAYIWLKKYTFLPEGIFLHFPYFTLGLSYIFFRVLHLLIETGEGSETAHIGLGAYLLYTLNFTTFVSGPIQRYDEFARDQFAIQPISLGPRVIGLQVERIIRGFFKVNVLAMLLHSAQQDALAHMSQPMPLDVRLFSAFQLAVVYPFFLYANFSGYIDIVIALARLMRVRLPENFDRPFSASSFLDFWNRWHITLSSWLKTYVYNSLLLGLMRQFPSPAITSLIGVFSFFVTFFLVGIWHGRTSEFVVFGLLQGGGVATNKLWQLGLTRILGRGRYKTLTRNSVYIAFGRGATFSWFAFTLFWFWADWKQIDMIFAAIGGFQWLIVWLTIVLCASVVLAGWERLRARLLSIQTNGNPALTNRYARTAFTSALALCSFVLTLLLNQPAPALVYKAF